MLRAGFGASLGAVGDQGVTIPSRRAGSAADHIAEDIALIRERFCLPGVFQPTPFTLAAGASMRVDMSQTVVNALAVSVQAGVLNVWIGDYTGSVAAGAIPHFQYGVTGAPVQIALPPGEYVFTIQATAAGASTGTFSPMAI